MISVVRMVCASISLLLFLRQYFDLQSDRPMKNLYAPACVLAVAFVFFQTGTSNASAASSENVRQTDSGVRVKTAEGQTKVEFWNDRVMRVTHEPADFSPTSRSLAVVGQQSKVDWKFSEQGEDLVLASSKGQVRVDKTSGRVQFFDATGGVLLSEANDGTSIKPNSVGSAKNTHKLSQQFDYDSREAIFGLGQQPDGKMNRVGSGVHLMQENRFVAVPVLMSSKGYGLFWDNPAVTDVNVDAGVEEVIPPSALFNEDGKAGGLAGQYFKKPDFKDAVETRTDEKIDFDWSQKAPLKDFPRQWFSARWTGFVEAPESGEYILTLVVDDFARLWIDDRQVIDCWETPGVYTLQAKVKLTAKTRHKIRLEYGQGAGGAQLRLKWRKPSDSHLVTWTSEAGDAIDYYFFFGPEADDVVAAYRSLTGAAPMFPRWTWGFWQSRERYKTQEEILGIVKEYRKRGIPFDAVIQDWQFWPPLNQKTAGGGWGSHEFDPARYPDPAAMIKEIHDLNAHIMVVSWAKFDVTDGGVSIPNLQELEKVNGAFNPPIPYVFPAGRGKWYDPFNDAARKVYWNLMSKKLFSLDVDAWWLDASEAEFSGKWGEFRDFNTAKGSGALVFNAYPLEHTRAVYEGQRADSSKKRVFILTRSAYAGQQRNAAVTWSGDIHGDWAVFREQISAGLNFAASGIPYWNTDIGGFFGNDPGNPKFVELFTRWFQFGSFCPMFRVHGTDKPKEIWRFDEATQKILIGYVNLRYHLLPYIYSISWKVTNEGYTMMRPLVMDFRTDDKALDISDQFMFGTAMMACPVTAAKAKSRSVYLPNGVRWFDFWTGESFDGGQKIDAASPIQTMPIFVRAGSILPYGPAVQYAGEKLGDPIELRVYPGADGSFTLYEDEGDNYNYEKGAFAVIPIRWNDKAKTLVVGERKGSFPGIVKERIFRVVVVRPKNGVGLASSEKVDAEVKYDGKETTVAVGP